ncbi:MAG: phosphoenolpyruvate--protein phosphotransferase [Candidatus Omnitrophota bacterium]
MKRNHAKLICDIGELSMTCTKSPCLEAFLQQSAELTASHMNSEVCSIYLYFEERQELVLKATKGLKREAVDKVTLKPGEGLTGLALKELRPISVKEASKHPDYKYFPSIGEEKYESFLAVPILRGHNRIGVIVVQNSKRNFFTDDDINTLRAITSQLANTIETVKVLMSIERKEKEEAEPDVDFTAMKFFKGRSGSVGVAEGKAAALQSKQQYFLCDQCLEQAKSYTLEDFYHAVSLTESELDRLQKQVEEKLADVASLIFTAQVLMLKDRSFIDAIVQRVKKGINPPLAVKQIVHEYTHRFQSLENAYLREKAHDVQDVGISLLENLIGSAAHQYDYSDRIVVAREVFPSDMLKLSSLGVKGLILLTGGITSHIAILARSLEIPLVFIDDFRLLKLSRRHFILLDADNGNIYIDPEQKVLDAFREKHPKQDFEMLAKLVKPSTHTADGARVIIQANINLLCDLKTARAFKAEGIGLYRSEFPFIVRPDFPTEEEQFVIYEKLVKGLPGQEITFRTLDIGGDKVLSYYEYEKEENPFLGMRSIRFSLQHKDIFRQQLRAILRAGAGADLRIMFPMISSVDEFIEARQELFDCIRELKQQGKPCHDLPKVGMMVELPSVVELINEFAGAADFFSIGTNDFIQYMLAVDRTNEKVAYLYLPHHPAVLRSLKKVADAVIGHGKEIAVCGDMAYDERYLEFFIGIGIRKFSVDSHLVPRTQQLVEKISVPAAEKLAFEWLRENKVADLSRRVEGNQEQN